VALIQVYYCKNFLDLNKKEFLISLCLIIKTLAIVLLPNIVLTSMHMSVNKSVFLALKNVYGIGKSKSVFICKQLGFCFSSNVVK
jgi:hypothetical protein